MSYGTKGETPPDTVVIAHSDLAQIFPAGANPRNVSVAPPRKVPHGWGFCLRATVDWSNGPPRKVTMWVTVVSAGIYDRKPAEPADQCELEEFIVVTPA